MDKEILHPTPGPWEVVKGRFHFRIRSRLREIAFVRYLGFKSSGWTTEVDARLMAASPDMLEALGRVLVAFKGAQQQHEQNALNEVRAAIAKATGRHL